MKESLQREKKTIDKKKIKKGWNRERKKNKWTVLQWRKEKEY